MQCRLQPPDCTIDHRVQIDGCGISDHVVDPLHGCKTGHGMMQLGGAFVDDAEELIGRFIAWRDCAETACRGHHVDHGTTQLIRQRGPGLCKFKADMGKFLASGVHRRLRASRGIERADQRDEHRSGACIDRHRVVGPAYSRRRIAVVNHNDRAPCRNTSEITERELGSRDVVP